MRSLILCSALLLAACDAAPSNTTAASSEAQPPSAFQNQVVAMSDEARNVVFIRAIRDAGHDCQGVTQSERRADQPDGNLLYQATCNDGASYGVSLGRDGTAQVIGAGR